MSSVETQISGPMNGPTLLDYFSDCFAALTTGGDGIFGGIQNGTGASMTSFTGLGADHPGVISFDMGTTNAGRCGAGMNSGSIVFGGAEWKMESMIRLPVLSTAGERFITYHGFLNSYTAAPTIGAWIEYSDNTNGGRFQCSVGNAAGVTVVDSGVTVAASTWYKLRVTVNGAGTQVQFWINDVLVATVTTNIPTDISGTYCGAATFSRKTVGITSRVMLMDYYNLLMAPTTVR